MTLILGGVIDEQGLAHVSTTLQDISWNEGRATAGALAAAVKHNQQADLTSRTGQALHSYLLTKINAHPLFKQAAYPKTISRLMISKTGIGQGYGDHVDNALMGSGTGMMRSDLSFTLFLSPPDQYEGGDLILETSLEAPAIKLPAGDLFLYPSEFIHRVEPVTRGERLVCVGWVQSMIRDPDARQTLWDLETVRAALTSETPREVRLTLDKAINSLLRRWSEP